MLTLTGIAIFGLLVYFYRTGKERIFFIPSTIDLFVYIFVVTNALSLLFSWYIFDITNFRFLLSAAIQYIAIRSVTFSQRERRIIIYALGITTLIVSFISLLQVLFKDQATAVAKNFLFGDAAYSIATDLARGRGIQWGNIILTFPFFIYVAAEYNANKQRLFRAFSRIGIFLLPLSFVLSNFRGLTICFVLGASACLYVLIRYKVLTTRRIVSLLTITTIALVIGVMLASSVFQYNLIDRFLFKEEDRDIQFTLGRLPLYEQALSAFVASPIIGIGLGNYRYTVDRIRVVSYYNIIDGETGVKESEKESVSSHNDFLTVLSETGLLGFISYAGIVSWSVKSLLLYIYQHHHVWSKPLFLSFAFLICLCMLLLSGLFENTPANNIVYLFFLFAASVSWF